MKLGDWDVRTVSGGTFRLDGGAMFGTVHKVVWDRLLPADADNQILMASNCLLLRGTCGGRRHTVLVETGNGDKESDTFMARFKLEGRGILARSLAQAGVTPAEVDLVFLTHLHFDHAGGATTLDAAGQPVPTFPNARYVVPLRDLENARTAHLRERASYLPKNWEPLAAAGILDPVQGPKEILPGLEVRPVPGHTPGLHALTLSSGGARLVFPTDLFPTSHHIQPAWIMAYDLDVTTCLEQRLLLLDEVADTNTILVFYHDPHIPAGRVHRNGPSKFRVEPVTL